MTIFIYSKEDRIEVKRKLDYSIVSTTKTNNNFLRLFLCTTLKLLSRFGVRQL